MSDPTTTDHLSDPRRKGRITASLVGAILGNSPYMTRDDAMRSMVREYMGAEREFTGNIATDYGNLHEAGAIMEFEMETGLDVAKSGFITFEDWTGCSPDGLPSNGGGLEVKCPFSLRKAEAPVPFKTLAEQPHYRDQVQFSMFVPGLPFWNFYQWAPNGTKLELEYPDQEWQDYSIPRLRQFHTEFLSAIQDPTDHLAPLRVTIDTPAAARMVKEWDDLKEQEERINERKADLLASMVEMAGERNADFGGRKLTLTKREGSISYASAIKALAPGASLEPYRGKPSESWGLR